MTDQSVIDFFQLCGFSDLWHEAVDELNGSKLLQKSIESYRQISNIRRTLGKEIVDHSDVVGASHVGVAPTTFLFTT